MKTNTVIIEVSGGLVQAVHHIPEGMDYEVLDWDNLLGDVYSIGDCERTWAELDPEMQPWIQAEYPRDYANVQERIADDRKRKAVSHV